MKNQEPIADDQYWTEACHRIIVMPKKKKLHMRKDIRKFEVEEIKLLELLGQGGQAIVKEARICRPKLHSSEYEPTDWIVAAKIFKNNKECEWPQEIFGRNVFCSYICQFYRYFYLDDGAFGLVMQKYDRSLRDLIADNKSSGCRRPFEDQIALDIIVQIALGMAYSYKNGILHRDLKADNVFVFVNVNPDTGIPWLAFIGDFDIAPSVVGTRFWRAPEILQALSEGKGPAFTPKADVYSFGMTCYEILTGGIPLESLRYMDYASVIVSGKRPTLPSTLIPQVKDLISKCWHHDPNARPNFEEIVVELKEVIASFGEPTVRAFGDRFRMGEIVPLNPERDLVELKALFALLLVKYHRAEFLVIGSALVEAMEQFQLDFAGCDRSESNANELPFSQWWARRQLLDLIFWKMRQFQKTRAFIDEFSDINEKLGTVVDTIVDGFKGNKCCDAEDPSDEERIVRLSLQTALMEEQRSHPELSEPHAKCILQLNHGNRADPKFQACDLCKGENFLKAQTNAKAGVKLDVKKVRLYSEESSCGRHVFSAALFWALSGVALAWIGRCSR